MENGVTTADDCSPLQDAVARGEVRMEARARGQYPGIRLTRGQLPGLRSIGYWDAVGKQSWGLPMHRNEGLEFCYLLSGETFFGTDSESRTLRRGDITITRPWQRHRLGDPNIGACRLFWMILDVECRNSGGAWSLPDWIGPSAEARRELLRIFRKNQRCILVDEDQNLKDFLDRSCDRLPDDGPLTSAFLSDLINHFLLSVATRLSSGIESADDDPHGLDRTIKEFFLGLEASVEKAAEPWTVNEIARSCRVGVTYLTSSCRDLFNSTPSEQLNRIRMQHAATLLGMPDAKAVTDVAFTVGFNSSQYFATRFRKHFGKSPSDFRRSSV